MLELQLVFLYIITTTTTTTPCDFVAMASQLYLSYGLLNILILICPSTPLSPKPSGLFPGKLLDS